MGRVFNRGLVLLLVAMLVAMPALANPNGPPWENGGGLTVESGCTCHGDGDPSTALTGSILAMYKLKGGIELFGKLSLIHI